jgi:hypothetical protein
LRYSRDSWAEARRERYMGQRLDNTFSRFEVIELTVIKGVRYDKREITYFTGNMQKQKVVKPRRCVPIEG